MQKFIPLFLILWSIIAVYWYACELKDNSCSIFNSTQTRSYIIADGTEVFLTTKNWLEYSYSKPVPEILEEDFRKSIDKMALWLQQNPHKRVHITGSYLETEKNYSIYDNLGLARAEYLKKQLMAANIPPDKIITQGIANQFERVKSSTLIGGINIQFSED